MRALFAALVLFPFVGYAGELAKIYNDARARPAEIDPKPWTEDQATMSSPEITEVGLEQPSWYSLGDAVYTVIFKADGTFTYTGERSVAHLGKHTGKITPKEAALLFQAVREMDFWSLDDTYASPATDQKTIYTMVGKAGDRKVVRNYGNVGPPKLRMLQHVIETVLTRAQFDDSK